MYIEPNSIIRIYNNLPIYNDYRNTLFFASKNEQTTFFSTNQNILKHTFTRQSYQRINRGKMRLGISADSMYDCSYLSFQNTNYGSKWFYAFINSVEYVNNETCEIEYEIDVIQTYLFDVQLKECFVEREHSVSDGLFESMTAENFNIHNYTATKTHIKNLRDKGMVAIGLATDTPTGNFDPSLYATTYANVFVGMIGFHYDLYTPEGRNLLSELIGPNGYAGKPTALLKMQEVPNWLVDNTNSGNNYHASEQIEFEMSETLNGYTPKNKKLFNYPFNKLMVTNSEGTSIDLAFEYFPLVNLKPWVVFKLDGVRIPSPEIIFYPYSYMGITNNYELTLSFMDFPQIAWSSDYYREWLNNNHYRISTAMSNMAIHSISTGITGLSQFASGNIGGALQSAQNIAESSLVEMNTLAGQASQATAVPNKNYGSISTTNISAINVDKYTIKMIQMCPPTDILKTIDDFFTMFGYNVSKVKKPNISSRPHFNYVKTNGCVLVGKCPAGVNKMISRIYDSGITFWKSYNEIGNYSLDNSPQ